MHGCDNMSLRVIKLRNAITMNILSLFIGCFITLNLIHLKTIDTTMVNNMPLILNNDENTSIKYIVAILTAPHNVERRNVIRKTWLKLINNVNYSSFQKPKDWFKHFFVIGIGGLDEKSLKDLAEEQELYNDILFLNNFVDRYEDLTKKSLLLFQWIDENFKNMLYLIKSDDDSFVRLDLVTNELIKWEKKMLSDGNKRKHLYWGYFKGNGYVRSHGKWAENDWMLCDRYLPYALGGGYVISSKIVQFIGKNADILNLYKSEDVAMGVWTAPLSNVHRWHDSRFDTEWASRGCNDLLLVRHKQSPDDMIEMYDNLLKSNNQKLCTRYYTTKAHYEYNWNVLPSLCCKV